jgi:hypothetical protein
MQSVTRGVGVNSAVEAQVDPTHRAGRVSLRPIETGVYGSYSQAFVSGVMAAGLAAGSVIFAWQALTQGIFQRITRLRLTAGMDTTAFAQGSSIFTLTKAPSLPAQYTGGAVLNLASKDGARRSMMGNSQQGITNTATGAIAVAGTATLTAGTPAPTLDNNPMSALVGSFGAITTSGAVAERLVPPPGFLIDPSETARQPLDLYKGEGFVIKATVPATGTWKFAVEVDWDEIDAMRYLGLFS